MNILLLKKFNNYFNRIVVKYSTLDDYKEKSSSFLEYSNVNFNPNDGVTTELIVGNEIQQLTGNIPLDWEDSGNPDYLVCYETVEGVDIIKSRWFITDSVRTRNGQYKLTLKRDVVVDNLEQLILSPVFVEKGWLKDTDPFIFNPEGMSYNEIKTSETLLKDFSNTAWIVGYIAPNFGSQNISIQQEAIIDYISLSDIAEDVGIEESTLASLLNFGGTTIPAYFTNKVEIRYGASSSDPIPFVYKKRLFYSSNFTNLLNSQMEAVFSWAHTLYKYKSSGISSTHQEAVFKNADAAISNAIKNSASSIVSGMTSIFNRPYLTDTQLGILRKYAGEGQKPILYNGIYYNLQLQVSGTVEDISGPAAYTSFVGLSAAINTGAATSQFTENATFHNDGEISVRPTSQIVYIQMIEASTESTIPAIETTISSTRNKIQTQNFDMFCMPLGKTLIRDDNNYDFYTKDNNTSLRVAGEIVRQLGSNIYDLQLLPYCPLNSLDISNLTENNDYNFIVANNTLIAPDVKITVNPTSLSPDGQGYYTYRGSFTGKSFWPSDSSDLIDLSLISVESPITSENPIDDIVDLSLNYHGSTKAITISFRSQRSPKPQVPMLRAYVKITWRGNEKQSIILWAKNNSFSTTIDEVIESEEEVKVESECNKYRLCSPNYQGTFDFNLAKNGSTVDYFIVECTYKPYTPYIKVSPEFKNLYGSNFGDARGLICSGDFSLPRLKDAWEEFELQNKNYQNIFNREIQNLDFQQDLDYRKQLIGGGVGILTSGISGAGAGAAIGGGWGALAGAVVGTAGSATGMAVDTDILVRQHREQKQLSIDKFNYQLGNIKALPYTLTKVGAFNINSKIWPFLEFYTCTDEEKEALRNKLKYESMTVMRINNFGDYYNIDAEKHYFKGSLIRNEEIIEDNHIFEAIYAELLKGVYI